ncbi:MAG: NADH-quinone oxidoreductase subunit B family protein [Ferrimicrobium sp.]
MGEVLGGDSLVIQRGSIKLRHVDAGSCNGCEIEIGTCFSPTYDVERFGVGLVASPRHSDGLIVTGVVTQNMKQPLVDTYEAIGHPKRVIAIGDCAIDGNGFTPSYAVAGLPREFVPVDIEVPGCPPDPKAIVAALRRLTGR